MAVSGSVTQALTMEKGAGEEIKILTFTWIAATGGTLTTTAVSGSTHLLQLRGLWCFRAVTRPGEITPGTDNYDVSIVEVGDTVFSGTVDLFGGELNNRSSGSAQQATPLVGNAYTSVPITRSFSLKLENNSAAQASGTVALYFAKG